MFPALLTRLSTVEGSGGLRAVPTGARGPGHRPYLCGHRPHLGAPHIWGPPTFGGPPHFQALVNFPKICVDDNAIFAWIHLTMAVQRTLKWVQENSFRVNAYIAVLDVLACELEKRSNAYAEMNSRLGFLRRLPNMTTNEIRSESANLV